VEIGLLVTWYVFHKNWERSVQAQLEMQINEDEAGGHPNQNGHGDLQHVDEGNNDDGERWTGYRENQNNDEPMVDYNERNRRRYGAIE
jgi:hypothetical protein